MEKSEIKSIIIVVLLFIVILFGTCEVKRRLNQSDILLPPISQDDSWKKEKEKEIEAYRAKIGRLQQIRDSLWFLVAVKKSQMSATRKRTTLFQARLEQIVGKADSTVSKNDTLLNAVDSLVVSQNLSDRECDETISLLENTLANRDTTIQVQQRVESDLKDLQIEQDLKNKYMEDQLKVALKVQKRKARQNKLLAGGLVFISGIVTAILITQHQK